MKFSFVYFHVLAWEFRKLAALQNRGTLVILHFSQNQNTDEM